MENRLKRNQYYLRERKYKFKKLSKQKRVFWGNIFEEDFLEDLYENLFYTTSNFKKSDPNYELEFIEFSNDLISPNNSQEIKDYLKKTSFVYLYLFEPFLIRGYFIFKERIKKIEFLNEKIEEIFLKSFSLDIERVSVRTLLKEHEKNSFQIKNHPVLERCIVESMYRNIDFWLEFAGRLKKDKTEIEEKILDNIKFSNIEEIYFTNSDSHQLGKRVISIKLDNGKKIIYKPHNIKNERYFNEFLYFFGKKCDMDIYLSKMVVREGYGWTEYVECYGCKNVSELERYYSRIGVLLFLTHLLGAGDIHFENIIAKGEYPIIIDMEVLTKMKRKKCKEGYSTIWEFLGSSVLSVGMLPYFHWNKNGKGVDLSGVSGGDNKALSFNVPVIKQSVNKGMHIAYEPAKIGKSNNRAMLNNLFIEPWEYEKNIVKAFEKAYIYMQ